MKMTNEEAIKVLRGLSELRKTYGGNSFKYEAMAMDKGIEALESQRVGHWINIKNRRGYLHLTCDCCLYNDLKCTLYDIPKFCPNCGARIIGEDKDERL